MKITDSNVAKCYEHLTNSNKIMLLNGKSKTTEIFIFYICLAK
jgi:hypothetical protein